jgi:iron complex transport system substrate-binding protein
MYRALTEPKIPILGKPGRLVLLAALFLAGCLPAWCSRELKDETGRTVELPDHIARVISLTPSITNTIFALGGGSQLVAVTDYTAYPAEARQKPSVGDILHPSVERIAALHPDVVIALSTLNSPDTIRSLERIGVPVFLLVGQDLAGLYRSIDNIGRVLGRDKEAKALSLSLHAREQRIREQAVNGPHPKVLLLLSIDPCITAGNGAFISEMIAATGARSVTADVKQDWARMSIEALLPRNPDYLLALMDAPFELKDLRSRPGWNQLNAVRQGRIIRVDDRLQVPGPVAFDGLEELARELRKAEAHR